MANKNLFKSTSRGRAAPPADATNEAGGRAYAMSARHALAQLAATGTMNDTYYVSGEAQLQKVIELAAGVEPEFLAKLALYSRRDGKMKDMPALICAHLATRDGAVLARVFPRVIDNGKMLRNFVQILRSGAAGRKSLGTRPKKLVQEWFAKREPVQVFWQSVGSDPSLGDILKLSHPAPKTDDRRALYGYLTGRAFEAEKLPAEVAAYLAFAKEPGDKPLPAAPMEMLTGLTLSEKQWRSLALRATWTQTRMNLNTFARHGVFGDKGVVDEVAAKLRDPDSIRKSGCFPYQLLVAYTNVADEIPAVLREALQDAMDVAIENAPAIDGQVYVFPDVSGSMGSAVTGYRAGATTAARCIDVAALIASIIMRKNPLARVIPFEGRVVNVKLKPRDSVMTNAEKLAAIGGGSTNCSAPLAMLNKEKARGDVLVYVSDNESWIDAGYRATVTMDEWRAFKARNPKAKMVCIDLQPNGTTQAVGDDVLNVGGFSEEVFSEIARFVAGGRPLTAEHWVSTIESVE